MKGISVCGKLAAPAAVQLHVIAEMDIDCPALQALVSGVGE